jgi:hypothetical protein
LRNIFGRAKDFGIPKGNVVRDFHAAVLRILRKVILCAVLAILFVQRAEQIYESRLRCLLEPQHFDEFMAIEPESGDYFLGNTLSEAIGAARRSHPDRLAHAMRVGQKAAVRTGLMITKL